MNFKIGDVVIISDGKNTSLCRIDGVRKGHLRVGCLLFDWCGNEVDAANPLFKIYPLNNTENMQFST